MRVSVQTFLSPFCFLGVVKVMGLLIAEGREREMAKKHAVNRPGCISKHQELVRQISEDQSTMIIDALYKARSSSILSSQLC